MEPTKIPCLAKGISAGLWVDLESAWALAARHLLVNVIGVLLVVVVGILWLVVLLLWLQFIVQTFRLIGGWLLILLLGLFLTLVGGVAVLLSLCSVPPFGLPLGCLLLIKVGPPSRLRFRGFGRFKMSVSSSCLVRTLCCWLKLLVLMMFLKLGLSGLGLLRLRLLMLVGLVVGPFVLGVCSWQGQRCVSCCSAWWSFGAEGSW